MSPSNHTQTYRELWDAARWEAELGKLQALKADLDALIREFPETVGLKPGTINCLIDCHNYIVEAMLRLETPVEQHCPELRPQVIRFVHGPNLTNTWGRCRGRVKPGTRRLDRAEWIALGRRVRAIHDGINGAIMTLQVARYVTKERLRGWEKADRRIDKARCQLDSLVCQQHPDWPEFTKVFYGPTDPDESAGRPIASNQATNPGRMEHRTERHARFDANADLNSEMYELMPEELQGEISSAYVKGYYMAEVLMQMNWSRPREADIEAATRMAIDNHAVDLEIAGVDGWRAETLCAWFGRGFRRRLKAKKV